MKPGFGNNNVGSKDPNEPRVNGQIRAPKVRLIDNNGEMLGVMSAREAQGLAQQAGLDLVEISPNADPPVCKILDYGKYKYQLQKKANEARKKQKVIQIKEIKLRPNIDKHDLEIKLKQVHKFIEEGDKVKFTLRFRGREMSHQQIGMQLMQRVKEQLGETVKIEQEPSLAGMTATMVVSPAK